MQGSLACTTRGILRSFDWCGVASQLNLDDHFARSCLAEGCGGEDGKVSFLDCFRQWHSAEYSLAIGTGHSHVGAWDPFEVRLLAFSHTDVLMSLSLWSQDELLESCCKNFLQQQKSDVSKRVGAGTEVDPGSDAIPPQGWTYISAFLEHARSPLQCQIRWIQLKRKLPVCLWSDDEENALIVQAGRRAWGPRIDWSAVASNLGSGKSAQQCRFVVLHSISFGLDNLRLFNAFCLFTLLRVVILMIFM